MGLGNRGSLYSKIKYKTGSMLPLLIGAGLILLVFGYGLFIFMYVEHWSLFDSFYQVVITLSTVGFQETYQISPTGRMLTTILILLGVGSFAYMVGAITQILVEGKIQDLVGRRRVQKEINSLKNHYIVCGYGRIGKVVVKELLNAGLPVVVVEQSDQLVTEIEGEGVLCVPGDATADQVLLNAGLQKAGVLIACLNQVAENVYITLTARQFNPRVLIVARADREGSIQKLLRAGADRAMTPHLVGGVRMAQMVLRPTVTDFVDLAMQGEKFQMEELTVDERSPMVGKDLIQSEIRQQYNVIIVAMTKSGSSETIFNPKPNEIIESGDNLIMVGMKESFKELQKILQPDQ